MNNYVLTNEQLVKSDHSPLDTLIPMLSYLESPLLPSGSVTVTIVNTIPTGGWILYFRGLKRQTVISKAYRVHPVATELLNEAIAYLADISVGEGWNLSFNITGASFTKSQIEAALDSNPQLVYSADKVSSDDTELFRYLFSAAPNKKQSLRMDASDIQKRRSMPDCEAAEPGKAIITADASFVPAERHDGSEAVGGTGWVIGFHSDQSQPEVVLGNKQYYLQPSYCSSNTMELHALKDALEAAVDIGEMKRHSSRYLVYSDSSHTITTVINLGSSSPKDPILHAISRSVRELTKDGSSVEFRWTKGHSKNTWNNFAHDMATLGRKGELHVEGRVDDAIKTLRLKNLI